MAKNNENLAILIDRQALATGTWAAGAGGVVNSKIDSARRNGFRIMKVEYWIDYWSKTDNEGPILVGFSPTASLADIEAWYDADPQGRDATTVQAEANKPIYPLEVLPRSETQNNDSWAKKGTFSPRWSTPEGVNAVWFALNIDTAGISGSAAIVFFAKFYGVWLRD